MKKHTTAAKDRCWTMAQVVNLLKKGVVPTYRCRRKNWPPGRYIQRSPFSDVDIYDHRTGRLLPDPWSPTIKDLQAGDWRVEVC